MPLTFIGYFVETPCCEGKRMTFVEVNPTAQLVRLQFREVVLFQFSPISLLIGWHRLQMHVDALMITKTPRSVKCYKLGKTGTVLCRR